MLHGQCEAQLHELHKVSVFIRIYTCMHVNCYMMIDHTIIHLRVYYIYVLCTYVCNTLVCSFYTSVNSMCD